MSETPASELAAIRLRDHTIRLIGVLRCDVPLEHLEAEWKEIQAAYYELRDRLEKKASEG